ncbi:VOC family protein [Paenibacillus sp. TAB 01]|uniref:VOC family protein n=1 Tax=Paenibacillus sp. TAB 01 TaxID=3368988 RepID=UPI0037503C21
MAVLGAQSIDVITLFVEDLHGSKLFYQEIFSLHPVYQDHNSAVFDFANMSINLLVIPAAQGLIAPEAVASREHGARFQFTIRVDDVDAVCAELNARGVTLLNGPDEPAVGGAHRKLHRPGRTYLGDSAAINLERVPF